MSTATIEGAVTRAAKAGDTLAKSLAKAGATTAQVEKAFTYAALRLQAAKVKALTSAQAPEGFKLDMELPTQLLVPAPLPDRAAPLALPSPAHPSKPAGTRSGLTLAEVGGRMCKDARDALARDTGVPAASSAADEDDDVDFIDEDDDGKSGSSPSGSADDDIDFVD